ncbi:uncharacterized protein LOC123559173 [Mercenaria mercenaria]|uniref:uncharacterized protein LOC123559173 n=1 Tax=Mercenaria mercenaria TaxID=6596 RepID=UPI00234EF5A0|nr:uncharacterized protein LOC123559173 [Mercenaria mercenaria]
MQRIVFSKTAEEEKYAYERISTTSSTQLISDPVKELCLSLDDPNHTASYPERGEYHVLIKKGHEVDAKQECPSTFFGEYSYKVTDIDASTYYCGTGDEVWDVCTDYEQMTFNYTVCDSEIAYSANGSVFCLVSISDGMYTYHTVYNEDNTVGVSNGTYRFTCFMSGINSDGSLNVSQTPGSCKKGQTPNDQPVFASNSSAAGLNLLLKPKRLCLPVISKGNSAGIDIQNFHLHFAAKQTAGSDTIRSLSVGAIVGGAIGALILIMVIILVIVVCLKKKCWQLRHKVRKKDTTLPTSTRSNNDPDDLIEKNPNIPEENIDESTRSTGDMFHSVQSAHNDENLYNNIRSDIKYEGNADIKTEVIREKDRDGLTGELGEKKLEDVTVTDIKENVENSFLENRTDEILVTRVAENVNVLRKDVPHLNSTDNIFSEYDAAMTYKADTHCISKSDISINIKGIDWKMNRAEPKSLEYTRDDSDLNLKSDSKLKREKRTKARLNKSEGNLKDAVKSERLKRKSSLISRLTNEPLEWNFVYNSPYALTEKQKQENLDRKIRMQKRKKQLERRKREEKERRERENAYAFEKWKQRKKEEALINSKHAEIGVL